MHMRVFIGMIRGELELLWSGRINYPIDCDHTNCEPWKWLGPIYVMSANIVLYSFVLTMAM